MICVLGGLNIFESSECGFQSNGACVIQFWGRVSIFCTVIYLSNFFRLYTVIFRRGIVNLGNQQNLAGPRTLLVGFSLFNDLPEGLGFSACYYGLKNGSTVSSSRSF